jgi:hypothetical protein
MLAVNGLNDFLSMLTGRKPNADYQLMTRVECAASINCPRAFSVGVSRTRCPGFRTCAVWALVACEP